jgi:hypothetical protein
MVGSQPSQLSEVAKLGIVSSVVWMKLGAGGTGQGREEPLPSTTQLVNSKVRMGSRVF